MAATEITAADVDSAIAQGLAQLGLSRSDVKIEILNEGSKGVLGLGAKSARVRLTPYSETDAVTGGVSANAAALDDADYGDIVDENDMDQDDSVEASDDDGESDAAAGSDDAAEDDAELDEEQGPQIEGQALAVEISRELLDRMGFKRATCDGRSLLPMDDADQPSIVIDIGVEERDEDAFLSHGAEGLNALSTLVQTMWSHKTKSSVRVNLDVNGYKAARQEKLMLMAERMADRVIESGRPITLEPMAAIDRRIIHMALRDHPKVITESTGVGQSRKVQIKLKE